MGMQVSLQDGDFFPYTPTSGISAPCGSHSGNVLRSLHTSFYSGCTNLHHMYTPAHSTYGFSLLYALASLCYLVLAISHCGFDLTFPSDLMWNIFL